MVLKTNDGRSAEIAALISGMSKAIETLSPEKRDALIRLTSNEIAEQDTCLEHVHTVLVRESSGESQG